VCVLEGLYETVDHLILHCKRLETGRRHVTDALDVQLGTLCSEEVASDEVLSGFLRKSWN
jgi:hypothetical protein